jgi:tetratricopeptide (TPR) repeat protein
VTSRVTPSHEYSSERNFQVVIVIAAIFFTIIIIDAIAIEIANERKQSSGPGWQAGERLCVPRSHGRLCTFDMPHRSLETQHRYLGYLSDVYARLYRRRATRLAQARWKIVIARNLPMEDGERLNAADRLAQSLQVCLGDHAGALPLFEEVLAVSRPVDGNEDVNTLISMSNLASLHQKMGNHHLALPLFEEAFLAQQQKRRRRRRPKGKEAQDTLLTVNNLAMLHLRTERFSLSLPLAEKALAGRRRTLGNDHADTLELIHNLGLLRWHMANM